MSDLTLAARNYLAQQPSVTSLLGSDTLWDTWIFADEPYALVENSQSVLIVITQEGGWASPNMHNTMQFPRLLIDIWADPTRNPATNAVRVKDAKIKINAVYNAVDKFLHTVNLDVPGGGSIYWGTATQIFEKTGSRIQGSQRLGEPEFSPVMDGNGAYMGRVIYGVTI